MTPARVLYTGTRYDFDESLIDGANPPVRLSRYGVIHELLWRQPPVLEVNEPNMVAAWSFVLAQVAAVRLRGTLSRRRTTVVAYCIGNTDPAIGLERRRWMPRPLARPVARVVMRTLVGATDRLAFGSTGSLELYRTYVDRRRLADKSRLFEALPSPCACLAEATGPRRPTQLTFVGALAARKGVPRIMAAWDVLRERQPTATLQILGKGELEREVVAWATGRPEVSVAIDPPRPTIHRVLRQSGVVVMLSDHRPFREQVGLPVLEGLSHGCEIVTTSETGLADWLTGHGHEVVALDAPTAHVVAAVEAAFRRAPARTGSLADLPATDQRIAADRWMMGS
jgi:glycosyltransferase involved in cell wall biosynthesis